MKKFIIISLLSFAYGADQQSSYLASNKNLYNIVAIGIKPLYIEGINRAKYYQNKSENLSSEVSLLDTNYPHPFAETAVIGKTAPSFKWRGVTYTNPIYYVKIKFYGKPLLGPNSTPDMNNITSAAAQLASIPKSLQGKHLVFAIIPSAPNGVDVSTNEYESFSTNANNSFDPGTTNISTGSFLVKSMLSLAATDADDIIKTASYVSYNTTAFSSTTAFGISTISNAV